MEREREKGREAFRPFLRELYVRTQASIYNVPLARVVSKKSITQQHTRESCSRSPHGPPNLELVLRSSPLRRQYRALTPSLQASIFSGVPPPASHIFILYCPHLVRPFHSPRMEFFIKPLSQHRTSVYRFDRTLSRLNRGDIELSSTFFHKSYALAF